VSGLLLIGTLAVASAVLIGLGFLRATRGPDE
jgi:hypothetical protein